MLMYDGLYHSAVQDETPNIKYYHYLRFYEDGLVIAISSTGKPDQVSVWFNKDSELIPKGQYSPQGDSLNFSILTEQGAVDYNGLISEERLHMRMYKHVDQHTRRIDYTFYKVPGW